MVVSIARSVIETVRTIQLINFLIGNEPPVPKKAAVPQKSMEELR